MNIDIFFWSDFVKQSCQHIEDWSKIDPFSSNIKYQRISGKTWTYRVVRQWRRFPAGFRIFLLIKNSRFPDNPSLTDHMVFHYCQISKFWFFERALLLWDWFWADLPYFGNFSELNQFKKIVFMFMRNYKEIPRPYGFENFEFLTNNWRGAMRSKTQLVYRDLDWWPGPQKVQFGEITGY